MSLFNFTNAFKSAVLFGCLFCLLSCDQKSVSTATASSTTLSSTATLQNEPQLRLPRLVRGVYTDVVISPEQLQNEEQASFLRDIAEGLVMYDPQGNIQPAVAESWYTEDNKTWIFTLREQAQWSNGSPVTAMDFVQSWRQLATSSSPLKNYLAFLNMQNAIAVLAGKTAVEELGVQANLPRELQITLDKATPYLPEMLAHAALLPQYFAPSEEKYQSEPKIEPQIVSNGAYYVKSQQGDRIHLALNPYYWKKETVFFPEVDYQKIRTTQPLEGIDVVLNPQQKNLSVQYLPKLCTYYYEFNFNDPMLEKSAVRKSLIFLASARNLVRGEQSSHLATNHFLPQSMWDEQETAWSPILVEQLLQQNGITERSPLVLRLTFDQEGFNQIIGQRLVQMWSQSDLIHIQPEPVSRQTLLAKRAKGDFQIIRSGWCADYNEPSAFLMNFYSKSPDNKSGYHNEKVDALLEQSLQPISKEKRTALYQQISQLLQQDNVVLPVFQYTIPIYLAPNIQGVDKQNPTNVIYSKDLRQSN
ncbi:peptide ABC transporter substrate-binding protein [Avibacterium paragallinarum]|uniref:peptide ABC transporter substrate-binding protein n=1 Tax=Avibacterium paragallinarum TaxID=728 RepID=UPI0021F7AAF6|nr:peptide ABC transporter substrate-binding protein [Avibacterium paragallinarum]UXN34080.1 peptide ABC transporter substrate-binding protein [Avibacterium paragallinarum]